MRKVRFLVAGFVVLLLVVGLQGSPSGVTFQKADGKIDVLVDGKPFTTYFFSPDLPRPYFHPLRSADGTVITRGFPMISNAPGEEKDRDHPHHKSCWVSYGDVDGVDYWSSETAKVPGHIVNRSVDKMEAKGGKGVLAVTMDWIDNTGRKIMEQKEEVVFHGDKSRRIMDFAITFTAADRDVTFRDTKEGMFSIRLASPLKETNGGKITNATGGVGEKQCWGKKATWVDYSGTLNGTKVGVTMMDHPGNLRYPTTWHVRAYGLFGANPFGLRDFTGDKMHDGSYVIAAGKNLKFSYRILIHEGDAATAKIADEYAHYLKEVK